MMQQPGLRAASLDSHLQRLQRQPSIIDGADRPADHEPGIQIENRGQIQLGVVADDELGRVADPALIRTAAVKSRSSTFAAIGSS